MEQCKEIKILNSNYYIGLMTGTSLDGIDYALTYIDNLKLEVLDTGYCNYPKQLRNDLKRFRNGGSTISLDAAYSYSNQINSRASQLINNALKKNNIQNNQICAVGYQGQTIYHNPSKENRYSYQLNLASKLNYNTQIPVVSDFRQSDIALGGQGAPLTPAFHHKYFYHNDESRAILNIGGIANVTLLKKESANDIIAFDTGPGNTLIDEWSQKNFGVLYDKDGRLAQEGEVIEDLLNDLLSDSYFLAKAPKSTGQEYFNLNWLHKYLYNHNQYTKTDILTTLTELTAKSCANSITHYLSNVNQIIVCGGGVKNSYLISRIQSHLPNTKINDSDYFGISSSYLEAVAFAYFAYCNVKKIKIDLRSVTGASAPAILGSYAHLF